MNILPKKRWHVRTRENIARVRKDEQQAAEECAERKQRIYKAEQEARRALLRDRARAKYGISEPNLEVEVPQPSKHSELHNDKHVNFFEELEEGKIVTTKTNPETELEEKEKREKYEKQIGYLTYLGQDTVETTGNIPWYDKIPNRLLPHNDSHEEKNSKTKLLQDPLTMIKKCIPIETKSGEASQTSKKKNSLLEYHSIHKKREKKKKHKKKSRKRRKRHSSCSSDSSTDSGSASDEDKLQRRKSLELLRAERLKREKEERERTEQLMARLQGKEPKEEPKTPILQQKYNSQYNPELAKQNFTLFPKNQ